MVFGLNVMSTVLPEADMITPFDPVVFNAKAIALSDTTLPFGVAIVVIVFDNADEFTLNVIVFPLTLVVRAVPPANVISVLVLDATMFPLSPMSVLIIGVATLTAVAKVATFTLFETAVPLVFVVTTSKSLLASVLADVNSVSFGIINS
jgi:hypothetical protein